MTGTIELHAFMWLADLFKERQWSNPTTVELEHELHGPAFLERIGIAANRVEVLLINRKAADPATAIIRPGDRVALVPPGVPGPHRALLGFKANANR